MQWFDTPVIGARPAGYDTLDDYEQFEREEALLFADEEQESTPTSKGGRARQDWNFEGPVTIGRRLPPFSFQPKLWMHTSHCFGYIAATPGRFALPIRPLSGIRTDIRLKRSQVNITLDRLRVRSYPGNGIHRILLHFYVQNQVPGQTEDVHYNTLHRVREGEEAALRGYPLFLGLSVGSIGLRLRVRTINVSNDQDEAFLSFLESDSIKAGLRLAATAQPAIAPFSEIAFGLAKAIGERHRNIPVQDFDLGLDFGSSAMGARLAAGSYIAVQMPAEHLAQWNWQDWVYHAASGLVLLRGDNRLALPYNYLVFSISPYEE